MRTHALPHPTIARAPSGTRPGTRPWRIARFTVPLLLAGVLALYLALLWPWMQHWGTTPAERVRALPGDELVADANEQSTRAVLVRARAAETWRWLVQIGEDRAGFYSYTWLENLFGARIRNADRVRPEWQTLRAGDLVRAIPPGYLGGKLDPPGWRVAAVEPGHWFVLRNWGVFLVEPTPGGNSRLIVRTRYRDDTWWGPVVSRLAFGPVHFVMERRMLLGIRDRAEGRPPGAAPWLASAGFVVAVVGTALLILRRPHPLLRGAPPALLALAVLSATGDRAAAAAGFVALGLTLVGVGQLRRRPILLAVPVVVLLVLLLAPDAYVAFGLAFLAVGAVAAARMAARAHARVPDAPVGESPARPRASADGPPLP